MKRILFALVVGTGLLGSAAQAGLLNVPGDFNQIQDAVQAAVAGDTVLVAAGTFNDCTHPTEGAGSTPACVIMKSGVTLRGAGPDVTIIDAQGLGRGIFIEFADNCRVENLTVQGAFAAIYGAGILIRNVDASVEITDVRVTNCTDGGVICINNSSPVLSRVTMDNNAAKQGGGLAIEESSSPQVVDCVIDLNEAPSGAGLFMRSGCAPIIAGCVISNNSITASNTFGGGISVQSSTPTITNCEILNNEANGFGGGVSFSDNAAGLMEDCLIQGNTTINANGQGGGVYTSLSNPTLRRLVIADNAASGFFGVGGGLHISFNPAPVVENCTIVYNACGSNGSGGGIFVEWFATPEINNCIVAFSTTGAGIICDNGTPAVTCSNIYGNEGGDALCGTDGGGNFSADPLLCGGPVGRRAPGDEFKLTADSPCAPGNHPGICNDELIGALGTGCGETAVPLPGNASLILGNHPNPFNPRTTIFFELPTAGAATLSIYDLAGRVVLEHSWDDLPQGRSEFPWNGLDQQGRALASGVYLYRLDAGDLSLSRRMSLIR